VWENVEDDGPAYHMKDVPREKTLKLWRKLARGDSAAIQQEDGQLSYGSEDL
jgi:hypothetical protein